MPSKSPNHGSDRCWSVVGWRDAFALAESPAGCAPARPAASASEATQAKVEFDMTVSGQSIRAPCKRHIGLKSNCRGPVCAARLAAGARVLMEHISNEEQRMKKILVAAAVTALAFPFTALAQEKAALAVSQQEAVVKVVKIDRKARTVTFQGPKGNQVTMDVPKEAQNLDQVKVGS